MDNIVYRGSLLPYLQDEVWDFDPTRGFIHRMNFKGASPAQVLALQQDYARLGIACRLAYNQGGTAGLEVEDSTMQYTIDVWELVGNSEARDGLSHRKLLALATNEQIAMIRQHLENNDKPSDAFQDPDLEAKAGTLVQTFYELQQRGSTEFRQGQYVLRHKTNAPNRWGANIADFGVDQIYTVSQLLSEAMSSALWRLPLPGRMAYKIARLPPPTYNTGYMWGWLKSASTETTAANNRVEISTEYTLEQWSLAYYDPY